MFPQVVTGERVNRGLVMTLLSLCFLNQALHLFFLHSTFCPRFFLQHGSYSFLNKKFKDFSRTHFLFFKDSIQCKKEP